MTKYVHTTISDEDLEVLQDYCNDNHVTVSAIIKSLVTDFLETNDRKHVAYITQEAKKVKQGRPKIYY